jgi:hypothetical protein
LICGVVGFGKLVVGFGGLLVGLTNGRSFFLLSFFLLYSFLLTWCGGFNVEFLRGSLGGGGPGLEWACGGLVVWWALVSLWWALVGFWWALVGFGGFW